MESRQQLSYRMWMEHPELIDSPTVLGTHPSRPRSRTPSGQWDPTDPRALSEPRELGHSHAQMQQILFRPRSSLPPLRAVAASRGIWGFGCDTESPRVGRRLQVTPNSALVFPFATQPEAELGMLPAALSLRPAAHADRRLAKPIAVVPRTHALCHPDQSSARLNSPRELEQMKPHSKQPAINQPAQTIRGNAEEKSTKRKPRICQHEGCTKHVVDRGLCVCHGGGTRCYIEDCGCRAQKHGLCWKHGGYTMCTMEGCKKRAKARGLCWAHGGGTKCKHGDCQTIAVSRGLCWAHGGGKRCVVEGCGKCAERKRGYLCGQHFKERGGIASLKPAI